MAVTWFALPNRPRVELMVIDPYTFREWADAMLAAMDKGELPEDLLILIDRSHAAPPTNGFVKSMVDFFRVHEERLAGTRAAVLVSKGDETEPRFDLRVGRFRIRSFDDVTDAVHWLDPDSYDDKTRTRPELTPVCEEGSHPLLALSRQRPRFFAAPSE